MPRMIDRDRMSIALSHVCNSNFVIIRPSRFMTSRRTLTIASSTLQSTFRNGRRARGSTASCSTRTARRRSLPSSRWSTRASRTPRSPPQNPGTTFIAVAEAVNMYMLMSICPFGAQIGEIKLMINMCKNLKQQVRGMRNPCMKHYA